MCQLELSKLQTICCSGFEYKGKLHCVKSHLQWSSFKLARDPTFLDPPAAWQPHCQTSSRRHKVVSRFLTHLHKFAAKPNLPKVCNRIYNVILPCTRIHFLWQKNCRYLNFKLNRPNFYPAGRAPVSIEEMLARALALSQTSLGCFSVQANLSVSWSLSRALRQRRLQPALPPARAVPPAAAERPGCSQQVSLSCCCQCCSELESPGPASASCPW
jgi:hypothetical protein